MFEKEVDRQRQIGSKNFASTTEGLFLGRWAKSRNRPFILWVGGPGENCGELYSEL